MVAGMLLSLLFPAVGIANPTVPPTQGSVVLSSAPQTTATYPAADGLILSPVQNIAPGASRSGVGGAVKTAGGVQKKKNRRGTASELQWRLRRLGYLPMGHNTKKMDYRTRQAVIAFQGWEGLERDGIAGPRTWRALRKAERPTQSPGERRLVIDIERQVVLLVRADGYVERTIHTSTGRSGNTPRGEFSVYRRERMSWSVPFSSWMPYAVYFVGGFALHAYDDVPPYPASAGCARLPAPEAPVVWRFADYGTKVVVR